MYDTKCAVCAHEIDEEDSIHLVKQRLICETCYTERICHRCSAISDHYINTVCDHCNRNISLAPCTCVAITWCQSTKCICRDCLQYTDITLNCSKCNADIIGLLEDESYPRVCEDGSEVLLCQKCSLF